MLDLLWLQLQTLWCISTLCAACMSAAAAFQRRRVLLHVYVGDMSLAAGPSSAAHRNVCKLPACCCRSVYVCRTYSRGHSEGIVHADLKAANVMLTNTGEDLGGVWAVGPGGRRLTAKVADFGLALPLDPSDTHATLSARVRSGCWGYGVHSGCCSGGSGHLISQVSAAKCRQQLVACVPVHTFFCFLLHLVPLHFTRLHTCWLYPLQSLISGVVTVQCQAGDVCIQLQRYDGLSPRSCSKHCATLNNAKCICVCMHAHSMQAA